MTREEAKIFLCSIADDLGFTDIENYTCKDGEKMREAIKTLSQEPCDDAISRQAVMDCFKKWQPYMATRIWNFEQELSNLPSVTLKPIECDAISRSGAIKAIEERAKRIKNEDTLNGLAGAVGILFELPPVNPQYTGNEFFNFDAPMVKKSMEQDAVSRQAVINAIENDCMKGGLGSCFASYDDAQKFRGEIEQLPSVTQKSGKWIEHPEIETTTPEYLMFYECSECGDKQCFCKSDIHKKRFCSNCGAKMVDPQESEKINCKATKCENCTNHNYCDYEPQESEE